MELMVFGQLAMVPILIFAGVKWCFDFWHVSIFIVMQLVYMNLTDLVAPEERGEASEGASKKKK